MKLNPFSEKGGFVGRATPKEIEPLPACCQRPPRGVLALEKILVPVDFSNGSQSALDYAIPLAKQFGAKLFLIHVVQPYPPTPGMPLVDAELAQEARARLNAVQSSIGTKIVSETLLRTGTPWLEIASAAKELGADLILLCTRGRTGLAHILVGSTAERVVRHAVCPVLVIPDSTKKTSNDRNAVCNGNTANKTRRPNRRFSKAAALLVVLAVIVGSGASAVRAQTRGKRAPREFMRDKLALSQQVLEGLVTEDFDLIIAKASKLSAMTQEADWRVFENPDYERYSAEFRRHVDSLKRSAENRNLDGATLAYTKSTQSCIECHKFVRGRKLASLR